MPITTHAAWLLPVRRGNELLMLKVSHEADERQGAVLLRWWDGNGAARVVEAEGDAILIERAIGDASLVAYAHEGRDDEATSILCDVANVLHAPRRKLLPELIPLHVWFRELEPVARTHGGALEHAAGIARELLANQRELCALHGDLHHANVLDFGDRGWLAIDPKRLYGDRAFDFANIFCNPDMDQPHLPVATRPDRFAARLDIVCARSGIEPRRMLRWIIAWTGLSAAWIMADGDDPAVDLAVAGLAAAALDT
jgi:streptomycin 6-kinase